ncbi:MAG: N-acetylmuramoyl-L-alanine amidase [Rhodobacteraceae bacterium]|nr:MAG: N-acetylmuramoyl-L-alanine amidase [Paracoccaceae bacterium]
MQVQYSGQDVIRRAVTRAIRRGLLVAAAVVILPCLAIAQGSFGVQARLTDISAQMQNSLVALELSLSQPVPYRLRILSSPPRLVVDLNTVIWGDAARIAGLEQVPAVGAVRHGILSDGWARLVVDLADPLVLDTSEQVVNSESGSARIRLALRVATGDEFEQLAQSEESLTARSGAGLLRPDNPTETYAAPAALRRPVVMLDPGHGGRDPGAERDGVREADIVLRFARQLREVLLRRGVFDVAMTRDADDFVSLDGRVRAARAASADVFLSIHADALPEGLASGAVIYLLGDEASDASAAYLAERHDRADMLSGVDLNRNTDEIARVLMSVAWQDTAPRARGLAEALVDGVQASGLRLHRRPIQSGAFTVLRAVDMPSVLIELGFMSSPRDLANLRDAEWGLRMAEALADALEVWHAQDLHHNALRRR